MDKQWGMIVVGKCILTKTRLLSESRTDGVSLAWLPRLMWELMVTRRFVIAAFGCSRVKRTDSPVLSLSSFAYTPPSSTSCGLRQLQYPLDTPLHPCRILRVCRGPLLAFHGLQAWPPSRAFLNVGTIGSDISHILCLIFQP